MAFVIFNLLCVAALVGLDQAIKFWAVSALQPVGAMPLIPHVVELRFVLNQGMAFSLLSGKQLFLIVATSAALLLVAYWLFFRSRNNRMQQAALILVLGGGIGNLIDRVLNGEVVDTSTCCSCGSQCLILQISVSALVWHFGCWLFSWRSCTRIRKRARRSSKPWSSVNTS